MEEMRLSNNVTGPEVLLQSPEPVGSRLSYYLALLVALLIAYLMRPKSQQSVSAPFYKASRTKWMFSADTLVRDSYGKVRIGAQFSWTCLMLTNRSFGIAYTTSRPRRD